MDTIIWKDIPGFDGAYEVSNTGMVRSKDRAIRIRDFDRIVKGAVRKVFNDRNGYLVVDLYKGNKRVKCKVHRLVMETFRPNGNSARMDVNHIDGDKKNNKLSNLQWCTRRDNLVHAVTHGLTSQNICLIAYKDGKEYHLSSIYGLYDILKNIEGIKCKRKTFGGNVCRALNTNGIYYGYHFRKVLM